MLKFYLIYYSNILALLWLTQTAEMHTPFCLRLNSLFTCLKSFTTVCFYKAVKEL